MSLIGKKWVIKHERREGELLEVLLDNRDIKTDESRRIFFDGNLSLIHDPLLLPDMTKAVERIKWAVTNGEKIMVFGDYDIDGLTGTALLYDFLKKVGADVHYTLPHREQDGYGLKTYFVERFAGDGVKLLITVDCGTSNVQEIARANALGINVIVTDHHSIPTELPQAYVLINPHRKDSKYPFPEICGSTIAYKLIMALAREFLSDAERKEYLMKQLSIVTLGVIGDCMPLRDENRVLVKYGLKSLRDGHNPGLTALLESVELDLKKVTSFTIGFQVGPRLNAAGRLDKPDHALELLLGNLEKADVLNQLNELRKEMVKDCIEEATKKLQELPELPQVLVLWSSGWKAGVLGLIASHLAETYHRPSLVMQDRGEELVGSFRSVQDFDMTQFLRDCVEELCTSLGGHKMAGGLTLPKAKLESFLTKVKITAEKALSSARPQGVLEIDCEIKPNELDLNTCARLNDLQPFGQGNPEPTLLIRNTKILSVRPVGRTGEHLQFPVEYGGKVHQAIAFRLGQYASQIDSGRSYDIVFRMEANEWNGDKRLQLKVVDLNPSE